MVDDIHKPMNIELIRKTVQEAHSKFLENKKNQMDVVELIESNERRERFWRQTFGCIESMLLNPMQMSDGSTKSIDHFRFPSVAGGDPAQHEWSGVEDQFDRYCKIEVQFDAAGIAVRTLPGWKSVDPDPDRPVGEFFV